VAEGSGRVSTRSDSDLVRRQLGRSAFGAGTLLGVIESTYVFQFWIESLSVSLADFPQCACGRAPALSPGAPRSNPSENDF